MHVDEDLARIDMIPTSRIGDHGRSCCLDARCTLLARLRHQPDIGSRLAAVPSLIAWGPTRWPLVWCELVRDDELVGDCGVHADVASILLHDAGVAHARGRAAIRPEATFAEHWRAAWRAAGASEEWIRTVVSHHEILRIGTQWWDPTEARWLPGAGARLAAGWVVAVREEDGPWIHATPAPLP